MAAGGPLLTSLADASSSHRALFLAFFVAASALRSSYAFVSSFWCFLLMLPLAEFLGAYVIMMSDALMLAAMEQVGRDGGKGPPLVYYHFWGSCG